MSFRRGRRLGIDVGSVRVGVSYCDPDGILAAPLQTVYRRDGDPAALRALQALVTEVDPIEIISGRPRSLDGADRTSADTALAFTRQIAQATGLPVRLVDERFTTTQAHHMLESAGKNSRQRREIVDAAAAVVILQTALDLEKKLGEAPGEPLTSEN